MTRAVQTLDRRQFVKTAAAAIPTVAASKLAASEGPRRPNVVYVFADQMQNHAMGCMGNAQVLTPNLDRLAGEGLLLNNCIAASPVCTPYRAQMLTGRYGHATGVVSNDVRLPDDEFLLSQAMKQSGYATGYIGKWHLAGYRKDPVDKVNRRGWDFWAVRNCSHDHHNPRYCLNDAKTPIRVDGWEPDVQTDLAIEFIKKNKANPFCLLLSFGPPHNPYKAPAEWVKQYDGVTLKHRPNVPDPDDKVLLHYYAMVTSLDHCMGRLDKALKEAGVSDDTILIFTADHGDMLGSQGHRLKQRPWEESINVPFIMKYPRRVKAGRRSDELLSSVDMMPSLLGTCGAPVPKQVQGLDQSATLLDGAPGKRDAAYLFNVHKGGGPLTDWRGIRTKEWLYAFHYDGDWVMYNLKDDPYQLDNLVANPTYAEQKRQLKAQLSRMRTELGEDRPLVGKAPYPIKLPG